MLKKSLLGSLALMLMLSAMALALPDEVPGVISRVIDGDTIEVQDFGTSGSLISMQLNGEPPKAEQDYLK